MLEKGEKGLKEVGDVQNWAECIERDLLVLEETLREVEEGDEEREREREAEAERMEVDGQSGKGKKAWFWG